MEYWTECYNCGGSGFSHHDCGEDTCYCLDQEDNVTCDVCMGLGGWQSEIESDIDRMKISKYKISIYWGAQYSIVTVCANSKSEALKTAKLDYPGGVSYSYHATGERS
jgi:hypothetical protein